MANSKRVVQRGKPRMTDYEALEALPVELQKGCTDTAFEWSAYWVLKEYKRLCKKGGWPSDHVKTLLARLKRADLFEAHAGWIKAQGRRAKVPSSIEVCGVMPAYTFLNQIA